MDWWRRDWDRPRRSATQQRRDVGLAVLAVAVAVTVAEMYRSWVGADLGWRGIEAYLWFGLAGLLLAGRRSVPLVVLLLESAVFIVIGERMEMLAVTFPIQMILFACIYSAWAWSRRPRSLCATSAVVLVAMFGWLLWSLLQPGVLSTADQGGLLDPRLSALTYSVLLNLVYFLGAMAWGHTAWRGAKERTAAEQRNQLELALAEQKRERAVSHERVRIARDLHDVVAHHVSSIGVQAAGAQRMVDVDPLAARGALGTIADSSREAVSQMHQLVHLLRAPRCASSRPVLASPAAGDRRHRHPHRAGQGTDVGRDRRRRARRHPSYAVGRRGRRGLRPHRHPRADRPGPIGASGADDDCCCSDSARHHCSRPDLEPRWSGRLGMARCSQRAVTRRD